MQLISAKFGNNEPIPSLYTCKGQNVSPQLQIKGVPQKASSLALILRDPDSPNGTFIHWVAWNIDPTIHQIIEGNAPSGCSEGMNDFGKQDYGGPCPNKGTHRYIFTLYALDTLLELPGTTDEPALMEAMRGHTLATADLTGTFAAT